MAKIIAFNMMSLDGYFEGLNHELDWHNVDGEFNDFAIGQLNDAEALVFGRKTYEMMAGYWPMAGTIEDDPIIAGKMNSLPKIVFSNTMKNAAWQNTTILKSGEEGNLNNLKKGTRDVFIMGSADLISSLLNLQLIDEFRVMINPVILGSGSLLFKTENNRYKLTLTESRTFKSGNVLLHYTPNY